MTTAEKTERAKLAATPGLASYTVEIILHHTTPIELARSLAGIAPVATATANAEHSAALDRAMGLAPPAVGSFDAQSQVQTLGVSPPDDEMPAVTSRAPYPSMRAKQGAPDAPAVQTFAPPPPAIHINMTPEKQALIDRHRAR